MFHIREIWNTITQMDWIVFSYSLPSKGHSTPRVALWRRLSKLGALSLTAGTYILPKRAECQEAFEWLAEEVRHGGGTALVMRVEAFEGLPDQELIKRFHAARRRDYQQALKAVSQLQKVAAHADPETEIELRGELEKLRREFLETSHIDYFDSPGRAEVSSALKRLERALLPSQEKQPDLPPARVEDYDNKRWVTRPRPHVDRLACIWLIREFIDSRAVVRYSETPRKGEIAFDMKGGEFTHVGNWCTFETMIRRFGLEEPSLESLAEIVHEIDLRDSHSLRPEISGVDVVLRGWLAADLPDRQLEQNGIVLFEGLYHAFSAGRRSEKGRR